MPQDLADPHSLTVSLLCHLNLFFFKQKSIKKELHTDGLFIIPTDIWAQTTSRSLGLSPTNLLMPPNTLPIHFTQCKNCMPRTTRSHMWLDKWQFFTEGQLQREGVVGVGGLVLQLSNWPHPPPESPNHTAPLALAEGSSLHKEKKNTLHYVLSPRSSQGPFSVDKPLRHEVALRAAFEWQQEGLAIQWTMLTFSGFNLGGGQWSVF